MHYIVNQNSDEEGQTRIYERQLQNVLHGICNVLGQTSFYHVDGTCKHKYPKQIAEISPTATDVLTNEWVDAHINVEICSSIKSVKYL